MPGGQDLVQINSGFSFEFFAADTSTARKLLEFLSRYAKLIANKIRLQLHHFANVFGLHQLSRIFKRGL
jgi:hypothetical protein